MFITLKHLNLGTLEPWNTFHPYHRSKASRLFLPPVGEKIFTAAGAYSGDMDILRAYTGCAKLVATDGPEVKVIGSDLVAVQCRRDLRPEIYKLGTAGAQRRAYGSGNINRLR